MHADESPSPTTVPPATVEPSRRLEFDGVVNFRDLGGYPTAHGRTTRWRTLFRADGLHHLTPAGHDALASVGLRTVVDLRTPEEIDAVGRFDADRHGIEYHHLSVIDRTWDRDDPATYELSATEYLHRAYTDMLVQGDRRYARAFEVLAQQSAVPAVFHCAAGKDRTGLLAALLLGALEVPDHVIVEDYALTQESMERQLRRLREDPEVAAELDAVPPVFFVADPGAMGLVLEDLRAAHGSVREYVRVIGVSDDVVDRLATTFLDD